MTERSDRAISSFLSTFSDRVRSLIARCSGADAPIAHRLRVPAAAAGPNHAQGGATSGDAGVRSGARKTSPAASRVKGGGLKVKVGELGVSDTKSSVASKVLTMRVSASGIMAFDLSLNTGRVGLSKRLVYLLMIAALSGIVTVPDANGQCLGGGEWVPFPPPTANFGMSNVYLSLTVWDPDGAGPIPDRLVVGGVSGGTNGNGEQLSFIMWWDGDPASPWRPFGSGANNWVHALTVGPGNSLVAGGSFTSMDGVPVSAITRYDGLQWHSMGGGAGFQFGAPTVNSLARMPNGDVVAAGWWFDTMGGLPARSVARWDGQLWNAMGEGLSVGYPPAGNIANIWQVTTLSDGTVVAGGGIGYSGQTTLNGIALWNGAAWSGPLAPRPGAFTSAAIAICESSSGQVVAGGYTSNGGHSVSQFAPVGNSWQPLGNLRSGTVYSLFRLSSGDIVAGLEGGDVGDGVPAGAGPLLRWDGQSWHRMTPPGSSGRVYAMTMYRGYLIVAGGFTVGASNFNIARWRPGPCSPSVCPADFNSASGVTVQDIFDYLAAYFAADPRADFNAVNGITVQDIFDFLAAYFAGCP